MPHAAQCFSLSVSFSYVLFERDTSLEASNDVQHAQNVLMSRTATRGRAQAQAQAQAEAVAATDTFTAWAATEPNELRLANLLPASTHTKGKLNSD